MRARPLALLALSVAPAFGGPGSSSPPPPPSLPRSAGAIPFRPNAAREQPAAREGPGDQRLRPSQEGDLGLRSRGVDRIPREVTTRPPRESGSGRIACGAALARSNLLRREGAPR